MEAFPAKMNGKKCSAKSVYILRFISVRDDFHSDRPTYSSSFASSWPSSWPWPQLANRGPIVIEKREETRDLLRFMFALSNNTPKQHSSLNNYMEQQNCIATCSPANCSYLSESSLCRSFLAMLQSFLTPPSKLFFLYLMNSGNMSRTALGVAVKGFNVPSRKARRMVCAARPLLDQG